ncbi:MAG: MerR family DNA-binding transcriptional regulator [Gammaproteobacteria bacterium]|nr:MAG: MerR family DNA-binding transcriptional regulator [Gammaproteobacteria bacterium]
MTKEFTISDLSKEFGVTTRAIRHYEDMGLLKPKRKGTQRIYTHGDRVRLQLILRGKRIGFSLAEIKEIIGLYRSPEDESAQRKLLLSKIAERRRQLLEQKACIEQMLDEMASIEARLQVHEVEGVPKSNRSRFS